MELLARCRDLALPFYIELFDTSLPLLRDHLFQQVERAGSLREQQRYLSAGQALDTFFPVMAANFTAALQAGFDRFAAGEAPVAPADAARGDLKLVERDELEDELAVVAIVSRAVTQQSEGLWALNRRLALLTGRERVTDDENPFAPAMVGHALRQAMTALDCELPVRIALYKLLGKRFLAVFGHVLGDLNELLREAGVLPELRYEVRYERHPTREADADICSAAADPAAGAVPPGPALPSAASQMQQQRLLRKVVHELRARARQAGPRVASASGTSYGGLAADDAAGPHTFDAVDYALILSALQKGAALQARAEPAPIEGVERQLFAELKERARPDGPHRLAEEDADIIDLVGLLFRELLDDRELPDTVKALLSHLHAPYLKLALLDDALLSSPAHPARQLLDRMADIGGGWGVDAHDKVVLPKLRSVVDRILAEFDDDAELFAELLADLEQFMEGVERRAALVARRSRDAEAGGERLQEARQRAAAAAAERLRGRQLPVHIERLLREPWTDFLAFNYLRGGEQGLAWRSALKVIDGVLWSIEGSARDPAEFARHRAQLERSLAEGLRTIGYASAASERMLAALREAQELAARGTPVVAEVVAPAAEPAAPRGERRRNLDVRRIADDLLQRADFGLTFEFREPGTSPRQLRLAWFSHVSRNYMFVNQAGVKQQMLTLGQLATAIKAGSVRLVEERPTFMARALDTILRRLQTTSRRGKSPARQPN